jgi:thiol-disulfide isomerase/thioredoxin
MYAEQYPGQDAVSIIDQFLQQIRSMNNAGHRDRRFALAAPIFQEYYTKINLTTKAFALTADIARATLPGNLMLLMGVDINGKDLDITSLNNKVVLLQFWGTWCPHCIEKIPELIALYEKYHAAGFEIIGVNTGVKGDDEKKVKQFVTGQTFGGKKIPWTILHEGLSERKNQLTMTKFYGIDELPVLILIDRNGTVLDLHPLPSTLDEHIAKATSLFAQVEFTEEEKKQIEENNKKRQEEEDRKIKLELAEP